MSILSFNLLWMSWNLFLALVGVLAGLALITAKKKVWKGIAALLWILFVPNTIYMLTDVIHLPHQWVRVAPADRWVLILQYYILLILAVLTYLKSMEWFEQGLFLDFRWSKHYLVKGLVRRREVVVMGLNLLIAFGVVMGRVMRTNSWYVVTQPARVVADGVSVIKNQELWWMILLMWMVMNGVYFGFRKISKVYK